MKFRALAEAFGETNGRAEVEGGLLLHAYLSTAGAAALPSHEDLGDILVVQLSGSKTWTFDADDYVVGSRHHQEDTPPRTSRRANPLENVRTTRPGSTSPATRVTNGATTWPRNRTRVVDA